jgi:hypothetical protein
MLFITDLSDSEKNQLHEKGTASGFLNGALSMAVKLEREGGMISNIFSTRVVYFYATSLTLNSF